MAQLTLEQQFQFDRTKAATAEIFQRLMRVLEARFTAVEQTAFDFTSDEAELRQVALDRINDALIPAFAVVQQIANLGAIFRATSTTSVTIGTGSTLFVIDEDERDAFAPAAWMSAIAGDGSSAMAGAVLSYDRSNGALTIDVSQTYGGGTGSAWVLSPTTPPLAATSFVEGGFYDGVAQTAIRLKRSSAHAAVPATLADGEMALNTFDDLLFWKDSGGIVRSVPLLTNTANGLAKLDGTGKIANAQLPAAIVGALQYQGTWNAATNSPTLLSGTGTKGFFYKVSTKGSTALDGIVQWEIGDLVIFDGTTWDRVEGGAEDVPADGNNKLLNASLDVWQRGYGPITVTTAGSYTADQVFVRPTGASVTVQRAAGLGRTVNSLKITGATGCTGVVAAFVIESVEAAKLSGQMLTFQAKILNGSPATVTPKLTILRPTAVDNYAATLVDINAVNLQPCAASATKVVAFSFMAASDCSQGIEVVLDLGGTLDATSKSIQISEFELKATPSAVAGQNNVPPAVALRSLDVELSSCRRRFSTSFGNGIAPGTATRSNLVGGLAYGTTFGGIAVSHRVSMAANPTLALYDGAGNSGRYSNYQSGAWTDNVAPATVVQSGTDSFLFYTGLGSGEALVHYVASAEIAP